MTICVPGEECLTRTQEAQRAFRKKFIEKNQDELTASEGVKQSSGVQTSNQILSNAVEPSARSDVSLVVNKNPSQGRFLNLTV